MSLWGVRKQVSYIAGVALVVASVSVLLLYYSRPAPTCFDGVKNQDELAPDCGGSCELVCQSEVTDLVTLWTKTVSIDENKYDLVSLVENPNIRFGIENLRYTFEVYDTRNILIKRVSGITYVNPNERLIIFEGGIEMLSKPTRTFLQLTRPVWKRITTDAGAEISVENEQFTGHPLPRITAQLANKGPFDLKGVTADVLVSNEEDNVIAVSSTFLEKLPKNISQDIYFTWPTPFDEAPGVCTVPLDIMMVFDRSGSMNDDGADPPQPLSDAQHAAAGFLENLSDEDKIGLVSFATEATTPPDQELSLDHARTERAIFDIGITKEEEEGFTNLGAAVSSATAEFQSIRHRDSAKSVMIILTDGKANAPSEPGGEIYARETAKNAHTNGISVYAIGLGDAVNDVFLKLDIASDPEKYYFAATSEKLLSIYNEIGQVVCPEKTYLINIFPRTNQLF